MERCLLCVGINCNTQKSHQEEPHDGAANYSMEEDEHIEFEDPDKRDMCSTTKKDNSPCVRQIG